MRIPLLVVVYSVFLGRKFEVKKRKGRGREGAEGKGKGDSGREKVDGRTERRGEQSMGKGGERERVIERCHHATTAVSLTMRVLLLLHVDDGGWAEICPFSARFPRGQRALPAVF
jgi:hypothetical protein